MCCNKALRSVVFVIGKAASCAVLYAGSMPQQQSNRGILPLCISTEFLLI
jgi:hypothetical protein